MTDHKAVNLLKVLFLLVLAATPLRAQSDFQQKLLEQVQSKRSSSTPEAPKAATLSVVPEGIDRLKIAPGFLLNLRVLNDEDYTGSYRVDGRGVISLPVIGELSVSGKTAFAVQADIRQLLIEKRIMRDPQVELSINEYVAPLVTIIGEVNQPGKYPLLEPGKLVNVLALAGGLSQLAGDQVIITSNAAGAEARTIAYSKSKEMTEAGGLTVFPGDTIQVKRAGIVYVLGAVNRPGGYVMQESGSMTLMQAVALANGTSPTASLSKAYILRGKDSNHPECEEVSYSDLTRGEIRDLLLRENDVVFFRTSKFRAAFMNSQAITSAAASAMIYSFIR